MRHTTSILLLTTITIFLISNSASAYVFIQNGTILITDNATFIWMYDFNSSTEVIANKSYIYVDGIYCYPIYNSTITLAVYNWSVYNISLDVDNVKHSQLTLVFEGLLYSQNYYDSDNNYQDISDGAGMLIYTIEVSNGTKIRITTDAPITTTTKTVQPKLTPIVTTTTKPTIPLYIYLQLSKDRKEDNCHYLLAVLVVFLVAIALLIKRRL